MKEILQNYHQWNVAVTSNRKNDYQQKNSNERYLGRKWYSILKELQITRNKLQKIEYTSARKLKVHLALNN